MSGLFPLSVSSLTRLSFRSPEEIDIIISLLGDLDVRSDFLLLGIAGLWFFVFLSVRQNV